MIRLYLQDPPTAEEIERVLEKIPQTELIRSKEAIYNEIAWTSDSPKPQEVAQTLSNHPILIERPLVILKDNMVLGRPPERVYDLFSPK